MGRKNNLPLGQREKEVRGKKKGVALLSKKARL